MAIQWKTIGNLTDKTILGTDGLSCNPPAEKSRAILLNNAGKIAVMYEKETNFYALPGGGIEPGEDEVSALVREIEEETGCVCDSIAPLGIVYENRFHADITRLSYFFVVHTKSQGTALRLTEDEVALGTFLKWCSLEEALQLIQENDIDTKQKRFLQARDLIALNEYIHTFRNK